MLCGVIGRLTMPKSKRPVTLSDLTTVCPLPRGPVEEHGALMPWKIVEITKRMREFHVSWRYRDDRLMDRCRKLCRQGWLCAVRSAPGQNTYVVGPMVQLDEMLK